MLAVFRVISWLISTATNLDHLTKSYNPYVEKLIYEHKAIYQSLGFSTQNIKPY